MEMVEAALLHDIIEDTAVTEADLRVQFGGVVAGYVALLTDPPLAFGNREKRKAEVGRKMLTAPWQVKTIKKLIQSLRKRLLAIRDIMEDYEDPENE